MPFAAAVAATLGACLAAFLAVATPDRQEPGLGAGQVSPAHEGKAGPETTATADPGRPPIYPYSIVQGGVHSVAELREVMTRDAAIAAHYALIDVPRTRVAVVTAERRAYMSYRIGDRIYWTKQPVALHPGERILTDGRTEIRARCGNCISNRPMEPVSSLEPDPAEFDHAIEPAPLAPLASRPLQEFGGAFPGDLPLGSAPPARLTLGGPSGVVGDEDPGAPVAPLAVIPAGPVVLADPARTPEPPPELPPSEPPSEPPPPSVPEPASLFLVAAGLAGFAARRLRQRARSSSRQPRRSVHP